MKKSVMQKWVKALRSGKYEQGRGFLSNGKEFCCLGVLADISPVPRRQYDAGCAIEYGKGSDSGSIILPEAVRDWAGMGTTCGARRSYKPMQVNKYRAYTLWELNDKSGAGFDKIADLIEKHYKDL